MRGAVWVVAGSDVEVFASGSLPADDLSLREALPAWTGYLDDHGIIATHAVSTTTSAVLQAFDGDVRLTKGALSERLHQLLPKELEADCARCGIRHAPEPLFRLAVQMAGLRVDPGARPTTFVSSSAAASTRPDATAREQLAERFIHAYGPTTAAHFAAWCGIGRADSKATFDALADKLATTKLDGRRAWMLRSDLERLQSPDPATGARLLPRDDPFLNQRDRATLAPDKNLQRRLWTSRGSSAILLINGALGGIWSAKTVGDGLVISIEPLIAINSRNRRAVEREAAAYAAFRGKAKEAVTFID